LGENGKEEVLPLGSVVRFHALDVNLCATGLSDDLVVVANIQMTILKIAVGGSSGN